MREREVVDITAIMHNSVYEKAYTNPGCWVDPGQKRKGINNQCAPTPLSSEICASYNRRAARPSAAANPGMAVWTAPAPVEDEDEDEEEPEPPALVVLVAVEPEELVSEALALELPPAPLELPVPV